MLPAFLFTKQCISVMLSVFAFSKQSKCYVVSLFYPQGNFKPLSFVSICKVACYMKYSDVVAEFVPKIKQHLVNHEYK